MGKSKGKSTSKGPDHRSSGPPPPQGAAERLLAAAEWIVLNEGLHAVTIRRIAKISGLNSALISYHFGGLTPLLCRLVERNVDAICDSRDALQAAAQQCPDTGGRLEALVTAHLDALWRTPAIWHPRPARSIVRDVMPRLDPALIKDAVARINSSLEMSVEQMIRLLPHLDRDQLLLRLRLLAGAADELRLRAHEMGIFPLRTIGTDHVEETLRSELIAMAIAGLRAKPARASPEPREPAPSSAEPRPAATPAG